MSTEARYIPSPDDLNQPISLRVRASAPGHRDWVATLNAGTVAAGTLNGTVAIDGSTVVGETLRADVAGLPSGTPVTFAWTRGGELVGSEEAYVLTADDVDETLTLEASADLPGYLSWSNDATSDVILAGTLDHTLSLGGDAAVGGILSADLSQAAAADAQVSYVWTRDGVEVGTAQTYSVTRQDAGKELAVTVEIERPGYESWSDTASVQIPELTFGLKVALTGKAMVGQTLSARVVGDLPADAEVTYVWKRGGVTVGTAATYTLTGADASKVLSVTVGVQAPGHTAWTASVLSATIAPLPVTTRPGATAPSKASGKVRIKVSKVAAGKVTIKVTFKAPRTKINTTVKVKVGKKTHKVTLANGQGTLTLTGLKPGKRKVVSTLPATAAHTKATARTSFTIKR